MRSLLASLATLALLNAAVAAEDAKPSAELNMLEQMIGTFDDEMTVKAGEWNPKEIKATAITKRTWAFGGKFIRGEGAWMPDKNEYLHLLTYDEQAKCYRMWYFDSMGGMPRTVVKGTWNEKARTLVCKDTDENGNESTTTHKFTGKDRSDWTIVIKNSDGKVMMEMSGSSTRRKE